MSKTKQRKQSYFDFGRNLYKTYGTFNIKYCYGRHAFYQEILKGYYHAMSIKK